jgi:hypothetical protein
MKNIFGGGALKNTNGLRFEQETSLTEALLDIGFVISPDTSIPKSKQKNKNIPQNVFVNNHLIGKTFQKKALYIFLESRGIDGKSILSKTIEPDDAIYIQESNTVFILEKKFQSTSGSVDEKLQTCGFKKQQYTKLFKPLNIAVQYIYILNDWFQKTEYTDVLKYIEEQGCKYFFNTIPLNLFEDTNNAEKDNN